MTQQAQVEALAQECADYATSLRSTINVVKLEGRPAPESMLRAADLFERAAARIADLERWQEDVRANSPLLARLEKAEDRVRTMVASLACMEKQVRAIGTPGWMLVPTAPTLGMLNAGFGICALNGQPLQHLIDSATEKYAAMLAAAPAQQTQEQLLSFEPKKQELSAKSEEHKPQCWCTTCRPITLSDMRFVVCPDCGNKRCPRAHNHELDCINSNEPGQKGSSWEHVQPRGRHGDQS